MQTSQDVHKHIYINTYIYHMSMYICTYTYKYIHIARQPEATSSPNLSDCFTGDELPLWRCI